jgi:hypothetical protein
MYCPPSYQLLRYEHGLSTAEQRAADVRVGAAAAAMRESRLRFGRALRRGQRVRTARRMADAKTASARVMASTR